MNGIDLFAGCGGMSLGFSKANIEVICAYELWDEAIKCYKRNFKHPIYKADLSQYKKYIEDIRPTRPDIILVALRVKIFHMLEIKKKEQMQI